MIKMGEALGTSFIERAHFVPLKAYLLKLLT